MAYLESTTCAQLSTMGDELARLDKRQGAEADTLGRLECGLFEQSERLSQLEDATSRSLLAVEPDPGPWAESKAEAQSLPVVPPQLAALSQLAERVELLEESSEIDQATKERAATVDGAVVSLVASRDCQAEMLRCQAEMLRCQAEKLQSLQDTVIALAARLEAQLTDFAVFQVGIGPPSLAEAAFQPRSHPAFRPDGLYEDAGPDDLPTRSFIGDLVGPANTASLFAVPGCDLNGDFDVVYDNSSSGVCVVGIYVRGTAPEGEPAFEVTARNGRSSYWRAVKTLYHSLYDKSLDLGTPGEPGTSPATTPSATTAVRSLLGERERNHADLLRLVEGKDPRLQIDLAIAPTGARTVPKPCCVCDAPKGKHCTNCKSRHYCSKACQLVDWKERGHNKACKQMAADFQDRLLDELMPLKVKIKEEPAIAEGMAPAAGLKATPRFPAVLTAAAEVKPTASNDCAPAWLGTCAICLDQIPVNGSAQTFFSCCGNYICKDCADKCVEYDTRCPLCRAPAPSHSEWLRRIQKHADAGDANAQVQLGGAYQTGDMSLKKSIKRAVQLYERAAAQGHAFAQTKLGNCYQFGDGVKINYKTAAQWYRRAAEQGFPIAQYNLGTMFDNGLGVAQSQYEAVKWFRLAAAQGHPGALYFLGTCYANGHGGPPDLVEALRYYKLAAAKGHAGAVAKVEKMSPLRTERQLDTTVAADSIPSKGRAAAEALAAAS